MIHDFNSVSCIYTFKNVSISNKKLRERNLDMWRSDLRGANGKLAT